MRRVMAPEIKFFYVDAADSQKRLQMAYSRVFSIAKQNILNKSSPVDTNGGPMYPEAIKKPEIGLRQTSG